MKSYRLVRSVLAFFTGLAIVIGLVRWSNFSSTFVAPSNSRNALALTTVVAHEEIKQVAICIFLTSTSKHGTNDMPGMLDGAATMRRSILHAYNLTNADAIRVKRTVGLEPYNLNSTKSVKWMKPRNETVSVFEIQLDHKTKAHLRFVAMTYDDVSSQWRNVVRTIGFEVWKAHTPMEYKEVRPKQFRHDIQEAGSTGVAQLVKLEGLRMKQFDSVLQVDCDILFHRTFNELILLEENLGWTHGGWESEKINAGILVYNPKHPSSLHHFSQMLEVIREGNFSAKGWRNSGIGWTYGGQTVQGILPYYYFIEANKEQAILGEKLGIQMPPAHREVDRCRYNNMVQLDKCQNIPVDSVISNHFTGKCRKPWNCGNKTHELCDAFRVEFFKRYKEMVLELVRDRTAIKGSKVIAFVNNARDGDWCIDGTFVSLSAFLASNER